MTSLKNDFTLKFIIHHSKEMIFFSKFKEKLEKVFKINKNIICTELFINTL